MDKLNFALSYLPKDIQKCFDKLSSYDKKSIQEIRLRANNYLHVTVLGKEYCTNGSGFTKSSAGIFVTKEKIESIFNSLCDYSIHTYENSLSDGYITIKGGNRVGFGGSFFTQSTNKTRLGTVSSINIRIAREIKGCSDEIYYHCFTDKLKNILICGQVASGKTTVLRDLCRNIGNNYRVSLIDERNEISASYNGIPQNDIGTSTDVIEGCKRVKGMETALRVLTPDIIICDEIAGEQDKLAIESIIGKGTHIAASVHADSMEDLKINKAVSELIKKEIFDTVIFLDNNENIGKIKNIIDLKL